jgi:hypothetical protein
MRNTSTLSHRDPLAAALAKLAAETTDPVVRQWLNAMACFGEGATWTEGELPPPPTRPAGRGKQARKIRNEGG